MKKLSIEEKAKAYDIALNKIKMLLGTGSSCSREELEYVFPELKESEDERIKKELIEFVKSRGGFKQEYIAWLEKQGEKDKFIEKELGCIKGYRENAIKRLEELEKQGEQKPIPKEYDAAFDDFMSQIPEKDPESSNSLYTYEDMEAAIKFGIQFGKQQKQEWSEEDEHRVKDTIYFLDTAKKHYASTVEIDACVDWLKSLNPQNRWKPSESDIMLLERIIDGRSNPKEFQASLYAITEQLKRLREEDV